MPRRRAIDQVASAIARLFYRVDTIGSVPDAGALLLLPNHPNALLDPALVMATTPRAVRFLAKSTLFAWPARPLMLAADAIPVFRRKDGVNVARNDETFVAVNAALARGEAVCVFPEGISHSSGKLEALRTGAARMALTAAAAGVDLQLVAVGINLERKTTFRSRVTIAYGTPFKVPPALASSGEPRQAAVKILTATIASHIRQLLVEADPRGDADLVERVNRLYLAERPGAASPEADLRRRRAIADAIHALRADRPEWYESAIVQLRRYDERLRRFGLEDAALEWDVSHAPAWRFLARELPRAVVLLPVALAAAIVFALPYQLTGRVAAVTDDLDVRATAKVIGGVAIYAAWIALLTSVVGIAAGRAAAVATALTLPALAVAGLFALERETAAWQTARAWLSLRGAQPSTRTALQRRRAELAGVIDEVADWMVARERVRD